MNRYLKIISIKIPVLFVCVLSICSNALADNKAAIKAEIKAVNKRVQEIEKIKSSLATLTLNIDVGETEGVPPVLVYYYDDLKMEPVMLRSEAGHEVFLTRYTYYFSHGRVIKYLKETIGHQESMPKLAIIYNRQGGILWKNIDNPVVSVVDVVNLFKLNLNAIDAFYAY